MIDIANLAQAIKAHGAIIRLVLAETKGSTPREAGADMLIWPTGYAGTIGGGRLEQDAIKQARHLLDQHDAVHIQRLVLGPDMGQCCGGAVTLVYERYDSEALIRLREQVVASRSYARPLTNSAPELPNNLKRKMEKAHAAGRPVEIELSHDWFLEPVWRDSLPVYIYGAGHVGRALAQVLAPMPQFDVHLVDVRETQFEDLPDNISKSWDQLPTDVMALAPDHAAHFIMTPEHDYDLELCHRLLNRSFGYAGLIGSKTKWARFKTRLSALGHDLRQINRITCPIGDPNLGKHPQAIAVGVCFDLLRLQIQCCTQERSTA